MGSSKFKVYKCQQSTPMADYLMEEIEMSQISGQSEQDGYHEYEIGTITSAPQAGETDFLPHYNETDSENQDEITMTVIASDLEVQYLLLLLQTSTILKLTSSQTILMSDYEFNEALDIVQIVHGRIVSIVDGVCNQCTVDNCLHVKAYRLVIEDNCIPLSTPSTIGFSHIHRFSSSILCIIRDTSLHIYKLTDGQWYCTNCIRNRCPEKKAILEFQQTQQIDMPAHDYRPMVFKTITDRAIPHTFTQEMNQVFSSQISNGLNLPEKLYTSDIICRFGYPFVPSGSLNQGIIVYTESDVISLPNHQVYKSTCRGPCECDSFYQGHEHLVLNLNNRYFVHYGLLYEYSEMMRTARNPLFAFVKAKNNKLKRMGRSNLLKYHTMYLAWNAYLRLIDINYNQSFSCRICDTSPETIIFDGVTLGTLKEIPKDNLPTEDIMTPHIAIHDRVWISSPRVRTSLKEYAKDGLSPNRFSVLIAGLVPSSFHDYVVHSSSTRINGGNITYHPINKHISAILKYLSTTEPISGIFQFSILSEDELLLVVDLAACMPANVKQIEMLYRKMVNFKSLFQSYELEVLPSQLIRLHPLVSKLLFSIIDKVEKLYTRHTRRHVPVSVDQNFFDFFPAFQHQFRLANYDIADGSKEQGCTKGYPKHKAFSPGMITMSCRHGICYGFKILTSGESTVTVFNILMRHFEILPKFIIYDNACNLHNTCLIRDPTAFRSTTFLIDRFHSMNHKCNPAYSMRNIQTREVITINSQVCEQLYSRLRRISPQIAYMKLENIFYTSRYFLSQSNRDLLDRYP